MSPKLALIARRMNLSTPAEKEQAPDTGIGAAIESMIQQAVEEKVAAAQSSHVKRLLDQQFNKPVPVTDYRELPPVQKTPAPKKGLQATIQRDGAGLARAVVINGQRFLVQRDSTGQILGMVSEDLVSEVRYDGKPVPPAEINQMRPRKLYGND